MKKQVPTKPSQQKTKKSKVNNTKLSSAEMKKIKHDSAEAKIKNSANLKALKLKMKKQRILTNANSKSILQQGKIVSTANNVPNPDENAIELFKIYKSYISGDLETKVLKGVDLKLKRGDFIAILGPSGSGKTTLLNIISGLDKANEGDAFILGKNLCLLKDIDLTRFRRRNIGFIFQQYNLLSNLTAKENAEVGANLASKSKSTITIKEIFETIGMLPQLNKYPHQMSGGEQQRVSIARALAKNPEILFGDEPTGALDEVMGRKVLEILIDVNNKYNTTVVVVTHNPHIAEIANTVIHVQNGIINDFIVNKNPKRPSEIDWS